MYISGYNNIYCLCQAWFSILNCIRWFVVIYNGYIYIYMLTMLWKVKQKMQLYGKVQNTHGKIYINVFLFFVNVMCIYKHEHKEITV